MTIDTVAPFCCKLGRVDACHIAHTPFKAMTANHDTAAAGICIVPNCNGARRILGFSAWRNSFFLTATANKSLSALTDYNISLVRASIFNNGRTVPLRNMRYFGKSRTSKNHGKHGSGKCSLG